MWIQNITGIGHKNLLVRSYASSRDIKSHFGISDDLSWWKDDNLWENHVSRLENFTSFGTRTPLFTNSFGIGTVSGIRAFCYTGQTKSSNERVPFEIQPTRLFTRMFWRITSFRWISNRTPIHQFCCSKNHINKVTGGFVWRSELYAYTGQRVLWDENTPWTTLFMTQIFDQK